MMTVDSEMQKIMDLAQADYRRDAMFRRYVDAAVHEAMRHVEHVETEIDQRDFYHVAVVAAMATLRLAIHGDHMLKHLTAERDHYKKTAEESLRLAPPRIFIPPVD